MNTKNIIGHISGLTELSKQFLFSLYNKSILSKNIDIVDVDKITNKIIDDSNMTMLFTKYEYYIDRSKDQTLSQNEIKNAITKTKQLEKKMNLYWKVKMEYYLNKLLTTNRQILLIGFLSFFKNHKINIAIFILQS